MKVPAIPHIGIYIGLNSSAPNSSEKIVVCYFRNSFGAVHLQFYMYDKAGLCHAPEEGLRKCDILWQRDKDHVVIM